MAVLETKAKEILIAVWGGNDTSYPTQGDALDYVIADTFSATQEDATEQTFEFETSDAPETTYTAGAYKIDLNNAELSEKFMTEIMGWVKVTSPVTGVVAPETYATRYVAIQVKMADDKYYFAPKVSIAPKLVMESIKTNLVYGTLSGTATNAVVGTGDNAVRTAFGKFTEAILTKKTES